MKQAKSPNSDAKILIPMHLVPNSECTKYKGRDNDTWCFQIKYIYLLSLVIKSVSVTYL